MLGNSESKHSKRIKSNCEIYLHTIIAEIGKKNTLDCSCLARMLPITVQELHEKSSSQN